MTRELGRTLSTLVHARRQVWLAQSPLTEPCRRTLRALPVVPGELFGSAALEASERTAQASRTRQQLVGLHRPPHRPAAAGAARDSFRGSLLSLSWGPQARLLDRDRLGPKGTMMGPRVCNQFGLLIPVGVSPGPPRARGPAGDVLEPAVGFFSPGQLSYWAVRTPDSWVLSTLSRGYRLQFRRRPSTPNRAKMMSSATR
ncbi:hypothetical protein CHARACLAT_023381 [Characodon lateralis]|uniref:Uncharacterized protein n=1 Tax=Characodon lateralis TaxID=208331 RepID=A0ABU7DTJ9_9TELE|nr:hypothetical protein [Characodon lateralis]